MTPRMITTEAELRQLPNTAVIRDKHGDVSEKRAGAWCSHETKPLNDHYMARYLPAKVLDEGTTK